MTYAENQPASHPQIEHVRAILQFIQKTDLLDTFSGLQPEIDASFHIENAQHLNTGFIYSIAKAVETGRETINMHIAALGGLRSRIKTPRGGEKDVLMVAWHGRYANNPSEYLWTMRSHEGPHCIDMPIHTPPHILGRILDGYESLHAIHEAKTGYV